MIKDKVEGHVILRICLTIFITKLCVYNMSSHDFVNILPQNEILSELHKKKEILSAFHQKKKKKIGIYQIKDQKLTLIFKFS